MISFVRTRSHAILYTYFLLRSADSSRAQRLAFPCCTIHDILTVRLILKRTPVIMTASAYRNHIRACWTIIVIIYGSHASPMPSKRNGTGKKKIRRNKKYRLNILVRDDEWVVRVKIHTKNKKKRNCRFNNNNNNKKPAKHCHHGANASILLFVYTTPRRSFQ